MSNYQCSECNERTLIITVCCGMLAVFTSGLVSVWSSRPSIAVLCKRRPAPPAPFILYITRNSGMYILFVKFSLVLFEQTLRKYQVWFVLYFKTSMLSMSSQECHCSCWGRIKKVEEGLSALKFVEEEKHQDRETYLTEKDFSLPFIFMSGTNTSYKLCLLNPNVEFSCLDVCKKLLISTAKLGELWPQGCQNNVFYMV